MDGDNPSFEADLRKLAAQSRRGLGAHPTPEQLTAYHAGELPEDEEERLRDHLALCRDCSDLFLDLVDFNRLEPPEGASLPSESDIDAAWKDLRARLQKEERPVEPSRQPPLAPVVSLAKPDSMFGSPRFAYGLAATFLVATIGLGVWNGSLRKDARAPRLAASAQILEAVGDETRSEGKRISRSQEQQDLLLSAPGEPSGFYQVEILEEGTAGKVIWTSRALEASFEDSEMLLHLPPYSLPPGRYQIRLYRVTEDERITVRDFPLSIEQ